MPVNFIQFSRLRLVLSTYAERLAAFTPNARLYLLNAVLLGAGMGVYRILFNFYVLSLGYDEAFLGNLVTASSLTALLAALPLGYLADIIGRKPSLLLGSAFLTISIFVMVAAPSAPVFIAMNVVLGLSQSLSGVTMGPFLMENSTEKERTYLFSFSSGLMMASAFVGNWIGGYLPSWMIGGGEVLPSDTHAYGLALAVVAIASIAALVPLFFLRSGHSAGEQRSLFAPLSYFRSHFALLGKLILPMLVTSIGAGLFMPFMNVFYRQVHHQSDSVIGTMFAWGSLAMGVGLLIAPPLAEKMGKIELGVITQGLSIPFLALLGFSPWFGLSAIAYYIRLALMNMNGPVYQTFVMEKVEPSARATVASLTSMSGSFGWAFSPTISGWLQVNYGFGPVFLSVIVLYILSVYLYWAFFLKKPAQAQESKSGVPAGS